MRQKSRTPTPGVEPGLPARQASVIAVRPRGQRTIILYYFSFLKLAITNNNNKKQKSFHIKNKFYNKNKKQTPSTTKLKYTTKIPKYKNHISKKNVGERIRTLVGTSPLDLKSSPFDHSGTPT